MSFAIPIDTGDGLLGSCSASMVPCFRGGHPQPSMPKAAMPHVGVNLASSCPLYFNRHEKNIVAIELHSDQMDREHTTAVPVGALFVEVLAIGSIPRIFRGSTSLS